MKRDDRTPLTPEQIARLELLGKRSGPPPGLDEMPEVTDWSGAVRGKLYTTKAFTSETPVRVPLPGPVSKILEGIEELEREYPGRRFTLDGHLAGSIGEVVAAKALNLTLYEVGHAVHDAYDDQGDVQIKFTAGRSVAMYAACKRLVVLRRISSAEAEIVYDGPGQPAWDVAARLGKNGQRVVSLAKLRSIGRPAAA